MPRQSVEVELKDSLKNGYYSLKTLDSFFYLFLFVFHNKTKKILGRHVTNWSNLARKPAYFSVYRSRMGIREWGRFESFVVCKQKISFVLRSRPFLGEGEKERKKSKCVKVNMKKTIYINKCQSNVLSAITILI